MRLLFVSHGPAHVPWTMPLAWAARLAGHEVRVAARRDCVPSVTQAGLATVSLDNPAAIEISGQRLDLDAVKRAAAQEGPLPPGRLPEAMRIALAEKMIAVAEALTDELVAFARQWQPEAIVHDIAAVSGEVAAAVLGVPAIGHTWGLPIGPYGTAEPQPSESYLKLFDRFNASAPTAPPVWIDSCPPSMRPDCPIERVDTRFIPYAGPGLVPDWLPQPTTRRRVLLTGGVTAGWLDGISGGVLDVLAESDVEVVLAVTAAQAAALPELPEQVRVVENLPIDLVLPHCDLAVHHGGLGTGMMSVQAGVPQVVLPQNPVQKQWGQLITLADAGRLVPPTDTDALRTAITETLNEPSYRTAAAKVAAEIADQPHPGAAIDEALNRVRG